MRNQFDVLTRSKKRELRNSDLCRFDPELHSMLSARKTRRWYRREMRDSTNPEAYFGITGRNLSKIWRSSNRFVLAYACERSRIEWEQMSRHAHVWHPHEE